MNNLSQELKKLGISTRKCKHCGARFVPKVPTQVICGSIFCLRKDNRERQAKFRNKKKKEKKIK